jgi:hypothetical protein
MIGILSTKTYTTKRGLSDSQKLFVEPTNFAFAIDEMDFQYPVPLAPLGVEVSHPIRIFGMNVEGYFVARHAVVRKSAYEVARNGASKFPFILSSKRRSLGFLGQLGDPLYPESGCWSLPGISSYNNGKQEGRS